ncbi:MAG: ABC transporter permease [Cyclobacteriaceae bacterium]
MLRNYWKTAIRTLWKHKSYTTINIVGLSMGITCSLLLFLLLRYWLSFDTFHEKGDRIYRIVRESKGPSGRDYSAGAPLPMAEAFRTDFPEVEEVALVNGLDWAGTLLTVTDEQGQPQSFQEEEHIGYVEPALFKIIDRPFVSGNPATALDEPNEVVISEQYARKYFGDRNPVGQTITMNRKKDLVVTGVMKDYPANTDFPFDVFISQETQEDEGSWGSTSSDDQVYLLLAEGQSPEEINARFPDFVTKHYGEQQPGEETMHYLQALSDLHFDPRFNTFSQNTVSREILWVLGATALFLILIACVNFINLATATSTQRAKEVGVRKVLGSTRNQLVRQFLSETTLITLISVVLALGLAELLLLKLNPLLNLSLELQLFQNPVLLVYLAGLVVIISVLSGLYPAWILTRFKPAHTFRNVLQGQRTRGLTLRKGLVVLQFVIAQTFIIGTLVLFRQMQYVQQADLGFRSEAVLTVRLPDSQMNQKKTLQTQLLQIPAVEKTTLMYSNPASGWMSITSYQMEGDPEHKDTQVKAADAQYLDVYQIPLVAGRKFTSKDTLSQVLANESFVKEQGLTVDDIVGKTIDMWGKELPIVGVVQDFHTQSLRDAIEPTVIIDDPDSYEVVAMQISLQNLPETLKAVEAQWSSFYPEYTFDYQFAEEEIAEFYESEKILSRLLGIASLVVVFIGCLGLYGLITFMADQKTKEVGVRKVLGASVASIVGLFSLEFLKLVGVAFLFAAPIAYLMMNGWLQNFEYKTPMGVSVFLLGVIATLFIALLTVSYRSIKAALANPVDSLRSE